MRCNDQLAIVCPPAAQRGKIVKSAGASKVSNNYCVEKEKNPASRKK